jgi:predicted amidohydrolase
VIFGITEKALHGDVLYNSCVLLGPNGIIGKHHKRSVWDSRQLGNEHVYWKPSNELGIFDSPLGKIGITICGNIFYNFPESLNELTGPMLARKGADLLVNVSAWPDSS